MMTSRWRKILGDIRSARGRFAMMTVAMAASVCAVTAILAAYSVLTREVSRNYLGTNPASAQLKLDRVDDELVRAVRGRPDIAAAEAGASMLGRIEVGENEWLPVRLFVVPDFETLHINAFRRQSGAWPPPLGSMLIERSALSLTRRRVGQTVTIQTPNGRPHPLAIAGLVHDPGLAPAWQEQAVYAYVTPATLAALGERPDLQLLKIVVSTDPGSVKAIEAASTSLASWLNATGHAVREIRVPPPRMHPHQRQMDAVMIMLSIFSLLALLLGAVLAATIISGLLAQQVRQIAIMKAIGARTRQIVSLYLSLVAAIGAVSVAAGLAFGLLAGRGFVNLVAELLNLDILDYTVPWWILGVSVALGMVAPLAAALVPILIAARKTVRESIDDYGVVRSSRVPGSFGRMMVHIRSGNAAVTLAMRNTVRRRARLIFTLVLLATAGGMFVTSVNLKAAWERNIAAAAAGRHYDAEIQLQKPAPQAEVLDLIRAIPGVRRAEPWSAAAAAVDRGNHLNIYRTYPDGGHGSFALRATAPRSDFVSHEHIEGRWLQPGDTEEIVLNGQARASLFPNAKLGAAISMMVGDRPVRLRLIGIAQEPMTPAAGYTTPEFFANATGQVGLVNAVRIALTKGAAADLVPQQVVQALEGRHMGVKLVLTEKTFGMAQGGHIYVLVVALAFIAAMMALVGILGLASALSTSVIERTREFGVLRAVGARSADVRKIVLTEGLSIGLLSAVVAVPLSVPLSMQVGNVIGSISLQPLSLTLSWGGVGIWFALVLAGSVAASLFPAIRASKLTIRQTLAYV